MTTGIQSTTTPTTTLASLEQRVAQEQQRINSGMRTGSLTKEQGTALTKQLAGLQKRMERDAFDANGLAANQPYSRALDGLSAQVKSASTDNQRDPFKGLDTVDARIKAGTADGSLTQAEAANLKSRAATLRSQLMNANTPAQRNAVRAHLESLTTAVNTQRSNGTYDGEKRLANFSGRITQGLANGSLTAAEATQLKGKLQQLESKLAWGQASSAEITGLAREFNTQATNGAVNVSKRTETIDRQIGSALAHNKLTPAQATKYRNELQAIRTDTHGAKAERLAALHARFAAGLV